MTEFSLAAYFIAGSTAVSGAFGSGDTNIKSHIISHPAVVEIIAGNSDAQDRITDGLDRIIKTPQIERYHYNVALAVEMLYAANSHLPAVTPKAVILGFTEDYLPALEAMNMPVLHHAVDVLAWGQEVSLPVPVGRWDDVTGQYYFDAAARKAALAEMSAIGNVSQAIEKAEKANPDAFENCDPEDVEHLLEFFQSLLNEADRQGMDIALFRHGGV